MRRFAAPAVLLVIVLVGLPGAALGGSSANLSITGNGGSTLRLSGSIDNGSVVRYAIDGNFTPLVDAVIANESQRASVLASVAAAESTPILSAFFGNRDGTVSASEQSLFESLLEQEARLIPAGSLTGSSAIALSLDGQSPTSVQLGAVSFAGAEGPVGSASPVSVTTVLSYQFPYSGSSHRLVFAINLTTVSLPIGLLTGAVSVSVSLPAGQTITSTTGLDPVSVSNDPLGWGSPAASGSFTPSTQTLVAVSFAGAFPLGTGLLVAVPAAIAAGLGFAMLRARRRRRTAAPNTGTDVAWH